MALQRLLSKMATHIGVNIRIIRGKDMEQINGLTEKNTLGNTCKESSTAMEYSYGRKDTYIKGRGNSIKEMGMHITGGQTAMSITDSGRTTCSGVREYSKKMANYTQ